MKYMILVLLCCVLQLRGTAQQVDSINVFSRSMNKTVRTIVITPAAYRYSDQSFPVVYLLHGYAGNETDWIRLVPSIRYLSNANACIIVCTDAANSWYINSPSAATSQYESFMVKELVSAIDSSYRSIAQPGKRAITGLSMGGHGALMLALRNPGVYGAAGSMSGGLDLRPFMKQFELDKVIADTTAADFKWSNYSVLQILDSVKPANVKMMIDCGVDDFFLDANRAVHQKLLDQKIAHEYIERPGGHTWKYWANAVDYQFLFFRKFFYEQR